MAPRDGKTHYFVYKNGERVEVSEQEYQTAKKALDGARMDREDDKLIGEDVRRSSRAADRDEVIANAYEHGFDDEELGRA